MYESTTAHIIAAIAAVCATTLLFALVVSFSGPEASNSAPQLVLATASATTE